MKKTHLKEILRKYRNGNISAEEREFLFSYYDLFGAEEPEKVNLLSEQQKEVLKNDIKERLDFRINNLEDARGRLRFMQRPAFRRLAAAAAIIVCFSAAIMYFSRQQMPEAESVAVVDQKKEHRLIHLPDGSTAILNAGSTLDFPDSFENLSKREVYLDGQAYFDIKHNPSKPFIVHTGKLETTVLGTAFNVKAWSNEVDIAVTVTRGKVKVGSKEKTLGVIHPKEQLVYNKKEVKATVQQVDLTSCLKWSEQDLVFDDVSVEEAANLIEERFDINIVFADNLIQSKKFTTIFLQGETMDQVLSRICEFNYAVYSFDKRTNTATIEAIKK